MASAAPYKKLPDKKPADIKLTDFSAAIRNSDNAFHWLEKHAKKAKDEQDPVKFAAVTKKYIEFKGICKKYTDQGYFIDDQRREFQLAEMGGIYSPYGETPKTEKELFGEKFVEYKPDAAREESFGDVMDQNGQTVMNYGHSQPYHYHMDGMYTQPLQYYGQQPVAVAMQPAGNAWGEHELAIIGVPLALLGLCLIGALCLILMSFGGFFAYKAGSDACKKEIIIQRGFQYKQLVKNNDHLDEVCPYLNISKTSS